MTTAGRGQNVWTSLGRFGLVCVALTSLTASGWAQATARPAPGPTVRGGQGVPGQIVTQVYRDEEGEHRYGLFLPAGYTPQRSWPVVLFLHGAGERGRDGLRPTYVGLGPAVRARAATFPFIAVFPQVEDQEGPLLKGWAADSADGKRALKILERVEQTYRVDRSREILTGWSMGGYGVWSLAAAQPDRWSAILPLSGGGDPETVTTLKNVPTWAFHGTKDTLVPVERGRAMADALKSAGGRVTWTELPDSGHDLSIVYQSDAVLNWMQRPTDSARWVPPAATLAVDNRPFVPAVEMPEAVAIRLGNEALASLAAAAPSQIPRNLLSGRINDMFDSTTAAGRSFSVRFSGLYYNASLEQVTLQAVGPERLRLQLGLRNVVLTISGTSISGARHSAQTGPIGIYIGQNRPVWLVMDVRPFVQNRRLRFQLLGAGFDIPSDNWAISQPAGVSTRGFGMTEARVRESLMSGLYGSKGRIENEVRNVAPTILAQLEQYLTFPDASPIVESIWPLPVLPPQVRVFPEAVRTDAQGVSLVLGAVAGSPDPTARPTLRRANGGGASWQTLDPRATTELAISPEIFTPLTGLVIDAKLARINVLDVPEPSFARLADRETLEGFIPELKRFGDDLVISTDFHMIEPLRVTKREGGEASDRAMNLELPRSLLRVSVKRTPDAPRWEPLAEFELSIVQPVSVRLTSSAAGERLLSLEWEEGERIEGRGRFTEGYTPEKSAIDSEQLIGLFRESWRQWGGGESASSVDDVTLGTARLRLEDFGWRDSVLAARLDVPSVMLSNSSDEPATYQVRLPGRDWSTQTVGPGRAQTYRSSGPIGYRRLVDRTWEVYTLQPGTRSDIRVPKTGGSPRLFSVRQD